MKSIEFLKTSFYDFSKSVCKLLNLLVDMYIFHQLQNGVVPLVNHLTKDLLGMTQFGLVLNLLFVVLPGWKNKGKVTSSRCVFLIMQRSHSNNRQIDSLRVNFGPLQSLPLQLNGH